MKRFITETEVEEAKKKREEEWKNAREAGKEMPKEEEEEIIDRRPLYEKLREQKDKKQDEFEEQLKFKNMIYKGLNEEDAKFLSDVAEKQAQIDGKRFDDATGEIAEYHAAVQKVQPDKIAEKDNTSKIKIAPEFILNRKSQAAIVASSIIRKRKSTVESTESQETDKLIGKQIRICPEENTEENKAEENKTALKNGVKVSSSLSLLADYPSSSSDDET